jgi:hypothetical protein
MTRTRHRRCRHCHRRCRCPSADPLPEGHGHFGREQQRQVWLHFFPNGLLAAEHCRATETAAAVAGVNPHPAIRCQLLRQSGNGPPFNREFARSRLTRRKVPPTVVSAMSFQLGGKPDVDHAWNCCPGNSPRHAAPETAGEQPRRSEPITTPIDAMIVRGRRRTFQHARSRRRRA